MRSYHKVLVVIILGLAGLSLVFLSAQLRAAGRKRVKIDVELSVATTIPRRDNLEAISFITQNINRSNATSWHSNAIRDQQQATRNAIIPETNTAHLKSLQQQRLHIARTSFQSRPVMKQVLEFVHITKTGGTAVEVAAGQVGLKWGICHWRFQPGYGIGCRRPDWFNKDQPLLEGIPVSGFQGELWHTPPAWFRTSPYKGTPTFTIVRNPYDRVVSEFYCIYFGYYHGEMFMNMRRQPVQSRERPNRNVRRDTEKPSAVGLRHGTDSLKYKKESSTETRTVVDYIEDRRRKIIAKKRDKEPPLPLPTIEIFNKWIRRSVYILNLSTGHMLPQYLYAFEDNGTLRRFVDHILKYESLHQEFVNLMTRYGLEKIKLKSRASSPPLDPIGLPRFTAAHLEPLTICVINWRYRQDFERFGYLMKPCENFDEKAVIDEQPEESSAGNFTAQ